MIGEAVIYVPKHLQIENMSKFDWNTPGIEYGFISEAAINCIFVKYIRNGIPQNTAQATNPNDLFFLNGDKMMNVLEVFDLLNRKP
jgi:hypothetical protein